MQAQGLQPIFFVKSAQSLDLALQCRHRHVKTGERAMMIQVLYSNGKYDLVKSQTLERLIDSKEIVQFKRSTGWVELGRDPIRGSQLEQYRGYERRRYEELFH